MKIGIRYSAVYRYGERASFSPHQVRLFPRHDISVQVERKAFQTHATGDVQYRHDLFDNIIAHCFYPDTLDCLDFGLELDLALTARNPFHFLLDAYALHIPFQYKPADAVVLGPYLQRAEVGALPVPLSPSAPRPTVEALVTMIRWIFENMEYERREEGPAHTPLETLGRMRGACRDFAVLTAAVLRENGIAARLASGFLWEPGTAESDKRAASALHAWVEVFLPGAGWIGLDPTNGVFCDHHFVTAAVGLAPADITPIAGYYYGGRKIESHMEATLEIKEL